MASRSGNFDNLEAFLNELCPEECLSRLDKLDNFKRAHLHYAARYNGSRVTLLLLNTGADPNIVDKDGLTPLHFAARYTYDKQSRNEEEICTKWISTTYKSVIYYLIKYGANVNALDKSGKTPLHHAARRGNTFAATELLKSSKINTGISDKQKMTPLHYAVEYNRREVVAMLLDTDADPEVFDAKHSTPLHLSASNGSKEILLLLLESLENRKGLKKVKQYIDEKNASGDSALILATIKGHFEVVKVLLQNGADYSSKICSQFPASEYPLHLAAASGNADVVKCFLEYGAEVNCIDRFGDTPLHKAASFNAAEVVDVLLENGSDIEARDHTQFTALLTAVVKGHVDVVEKLLAVGANIHVVDNMERNVVYWAAQKNHPAVLTILLNYGADTEIVDEKGRTPLHIAAELGHIDVAQGLINHCKIIINSEDEYARTPLHLAAMNGHYKVINALLCAGANIDTRDHCGWTPLHFAAERGWKRCIEILLIANSPVNSPINKSKATPLHLASKGNHKDVVKLLLKYGANIAQCDEDGKNCLDLAILKGHKKVALEILADENWDAVLRNESEKFFMHRTPFRQLIRWMPEVAERVLDKCITRRKSHNDYLLLKMTYNYEFIDDTFGYYLKDTERDDSSFPFGTEFGIYTECGSVRKEAIPYTRNRDFLKQDHPLKLMVKYGREELLSHPLCKMLLNHKWMNYGRYVYFGNLFIFLLFLTSLTLYVVSSTPPSLYSEAGSKSCSTLNFTHQPHIDNDINKNLLNGYQISVYFFAVLHLIKEAYQLYQNGYQYFNKENVLECSCYLSTLVFVADLTKCSSQTGIREVWQWQLGSLSIFSAWMVLLVFISKFPFLGIYVVMFHQILCTFLKFSVLFFLFLVAFAIAFFTVLQNQNPFESLAESIMKTSVMITGETEFDAIFNDPDNKVYFRGPAYFFFILFLLFMTIILMNMLIGLAVDDIKEVQKKATLKRLAMKVELVLSVERALPIFLLRKCIIRNYTKELIPWNIIRKHRPDKSTGMWPKILNRYIKSALEMATERKSKLDQQLKDIQESIHLLQKDMKNLQSSVHMKKSE